MKKPLISALCVLIFNTLLIAQPLIGTYTVGGNGSDFSKINDAVTQLLTFGVAGPVVFKINDGVYEERIKLTEVTGASAASTVTFESTSQDPNKVLITSSGGGVNTDHHTIQLYSCSNISFKYLTVENDHPKMATVIQLTTQGSLGLSANNTIENCILKGSTVSTSSNVILIMLSGINMNSTTGGNQINNNLFANNTLIGGSVGYHQRSSIASAKTGNQFINNYCVGQYLRAIDMRFNVDALTSGNVIDMTHPNFQRFQITGIYSLSGINEEISNNMIIGGFKQATEATGIHVEGVPTEVKVYHNSVVMDNDINEGNAFYIEYSTATGSRSLDIKNNIFYNKGIGNAYKINAPSIEDISSDYNLLYVEAPNNLVSATNFGNFSSLSAYSAASGLETNSISLLPRFISETDLHTTNPLIDATGTGVAVPNDIDGETRNATTPDIGADEFTPIQIDLAIAEINTTTTPKDGVNNIKILLRNEGVQSLNGQKVTILFSIDSGQTWVNPELITLTNLAVTFDETEIELSTTAVFTKGKPLNLGVKLENESAEPFDLNNDNNVLISKLCPYLSGEYTVGAGGDFVSFDNLIEQLACGGVLNNTLIKVKAGTYNTRFTIPKINGVDLSKTLTISSESLDANSVIIESEVPGTTTDHHIIRLDDADFVTLSNLTIKNIVNKPYLSGIHLTNNADNNTILNCRIIVDSTRDDNINKAGIVASSKAGIYGTGQNANNTLIENNLIEGGSYGVRINGQNPNYTEGSIIINNSILRNGYIGIRTFYHNPIEVSGNTVISDPLNENADYGIYLDYSMKAFKVIGNVVNNARIMGIGLVQCLHQSDTLILANNMIGEGFYESVNTNYGIYLSFVKQLDVVYNTVSMNNRYGLCLFEEGDSENHSIFNNIFHNADSGTVVNYDDTAAVIKLSNNNIFTRGANLGIWGNEPAADLMAFQALSKREANSISINPKFVSDYDLHTSNVGFDGRGIPYDKITLDVDNELRSFMNPDIGADETNASSVKVPIANFTISQSFLNFTFTSTSLNNPTSYFWDFDASSNAGIDISTAQNPSFAYLEPGVRQVCLTAQNSAGQHKKCTPISALNPPAPTADFTYLNTGISLVQFTDVSINNPSSWFWDLGDGQTSTIANPLHNYSRTGEFTVSLFVGNNTGSHSISKKITVTENVGIENKNNLDFKLYPLPAQTQLNVKSSTPIISASIVTMQGNEILFFDNLNSTELEIPLKLTNGVYLIRLIDLNNNEAVESFTIVK